MKTDTLTKQKLIDKSLLVSDNLALILHKWSTDDDLIIEVISMSKFNSSALISFSNYTVLRHNMSETMLNRAIKCVKRNKEIIVDEIKERYTNN